MYASIYIVSDLLASSLIVTPLLQFPLHLFSEPLDLPIGDHPPDLHTRLIVSLSRAEMVREGSEEQSKEWAWQREYSGKGIGDRKGQVVEWRLLTRAMILYRTSINKLLPGADPFETTLINSAIKCEVN